MKYIYINRINNELQQFIEKIDKHKILDSDPLPEHMHALFWNKLTLWSVSGRKNPNGVKSFYWKNHYVTVKYFAKTQQMIESTNLEAHLTPCPSMDPTSTKTTILNLKNFKCLNILSTLVWCMLSTPIRECKSRRLYSLILDARNYTIL